MSVNIDTYTGHGGTSEKWKLIQQVSSLLLMENTRYVLFWTIQVLFQFLEASKDACANALLYANENP